MSVVSRGLTLLLVVGTAAQGGVAMAQTASGSLTRAQAQSSDLFARDRSVAVRDRPHPDYEAGGLPLGAFTAYPKVQFSGEFNDNIYATSSNERDDFIFRIRPEISLESGWSRNALQAYARGSINRYKDYDTEDTEEWGVGVSGRLDVTRATNIAGGADFATLTEPRTSASAPAATLEPIQYDMTSAYLAGAHSTGRIKLSARTGIQTYDYEDGATAGGVVVDQDFRDRDVWTLSGRADYAVSPATALFAQVSSNERDYDTAGTLFSPARDSSGYEALVGTNFELGAVARGEIAVGYISQDFDSPAYKDIDGFGARAQVEWFPTQLTTVTATAGRSIEDAGIVGSGGYLATAMSLSVDHELRRNIILGGQLLYSRDEYDGIQREDERYGASVNATYLVNRNLGVSLAVSHLEQSSEGLNHGASYDINRLSLSLVSQF